MKRSAIIAIITAVIALNAFVARAASTFDITFRDTPIEQVISDLRKRTGYDFVYQKDVLAGNPAISGRFHNLTLQQILNRIFVEDLNVAYEIVDKTIILSKSSKELPYFKHNISGVVTDESGEPLIGATVLVEDTKILLSDKKIRLDTRLGSIPFAGFGPFCLVCVRQNKKLKQCAKLIILADSRCMVR